MKDIIKTYRKNVIRELKSDYENSLSRVDDGILTEEEVNEWTKNFIDPLMELVNTKKIKPKPDGADGFNFDIPKEKYWMNFMPDNDEVNLWWKGSYTNWVEYDHQTNIEKSNTVLGEIMRTLRELSQFYRSNITKKKNCIEFFLFETLRKRGFKKDCIGL